jgi:hypothetical protein
MTNDADRQLATATVARMVETKALWRGDQARLPVARKLEILDELKTDWEVLQALRHGREGRDKA